jgi:hypothetical protein
MREFVLEDNERLIGIRSSGGNENKALHYSVQFIVGKQKEI